MIIEIRDYYVTSTRKWWKIWEKNNYEIKQRTKFINIDKIIQIKECEEEVLSSYWSVFCDGGFKVIVDNENLIDLFGDSD